MPLDDSGLERKQAISAFLDRSVQEPFLAQVENGLNKYAESGCARVHCLIDKAGRALASAKEESDLVAAETLVREAHLELSKAINAAPAYWRGMQSRGYGYFVYFIAAMFFALFAAFYLDEDDTIEMLDVPIWAATLGAAGGSFSGVVWLRTQSAERGLRPTWLIYWMSPPVFGLLLGIVAYLFYELVTDGSGTQSALPKLLAFVAGYNWQAVTDLLDKLRGSFSGRAALDSS